MAFSLEEEADACQEILNKAIDLRVIDSQAESQHVLFPATSPVCSDNDRHWQCPSFSKWQSTGPSDHWGHSLSIWQAWWLTLVRNGGLRDGQPSDEKTSKRRTDIEGIATATRPQKTEKIKLFQRYSLNFCGIAWRHARSHLSCDGKVYFCPWWSCRCSLKILLMCVW